MEGGIHFRLLSRIVQRLHMPSVLYWGLGTSVYLHSSSSTPTDLWSQSPYYISVPCMPVKMVYSCLLVDADLAIDVWSSDYFKCTCPRTCHGVLPKHVSPNGKGGIIPLRYVADKHMIRFSLHIQTLGLCPVCPTSICLELLINIGTCTVHYVWHVFLHVETTFILLT